MDEGRVIAKLNEQACPFCAYAPTHRSAAQSLNKHLKNYAKKVGSARTNHPAIGTALFNRIASIRNFSNNAASEEERKRRRADTNARYRDKKAGISRIDPNEYEANQRRLRHAQDKVRIALASLRFSLTFILSKLPEALLYPSLPLCPKILASRNFWCITFPRKSGRARLHEHALHHTQLTRATANCSRLPTATRRCWLPLGQNGRPC
jgi:hypothetical protein